jgi:hypothetical protein
VFFIPEDTARENPLHFLGLFSILVADNMMVGFSFVHVNFLLDDLNEFLNFV